MDDDSSALAERLSAGLKAVFGAELLYMGSNALLVVLLTRELLDPESFGRLFFALSVIGIVSVFAALGLPKSAARYVTEYVEKDETQVRYVIRRSFVYVSLLAGAVSVGFALSSEQLAALLGEPEIAPLLAIGAVYVLAYAYSGYFGSLFQGFNRVTLSAATKSISGVARVVFAVGFVLLGLGAAGALLGYVVGYALAAIVGGVVIYYRYYRSFEEAASPESGIARRILEYSVPLTATRSAGVIDKRIDTVLVGVLLNPTAVGFYVVAKQVADVVAVPAGSFGYTLSPALGEQKAGDRIERAARLYSESLGYVILFYIPAAIGLVLVADPVVRLVFGPEYVDAVPVLQVLSAFVVVHAITKVTSDGLDYLGRARSRAIAKGAMAVGNVVLNVLLIPVMGVVGAAVATVVTYSAYTFANLYIVHQELAFDVRPLVHDVVVVGVISLAMVGVVLLTLPYVSGLPSLIAVVLLGGGVWMALSILSGLLDVRRVASFLLP